MTQNTTSQTTTTPATSAIDDGSKQLAWIIIGVMILFAGLTVVSYNDNPVASTNVKQVDTQWKAPKQVNAPAAPVPAQEQLPVTNESAPEKPQLKGTGELIHA
jgi:hypothetical protein